MKRSAPEGTVSVSGPGYERDGLPNVNVGISAAQAQASRAAEGTWYVRDGGTTVAVERRGDNIVVIPLKGVKA